ncbi:hypothetical protein ANCDUO_15535 [Ancylostoma duodenale]|uniref:Elongator complex protein 5 n=1 Tax=Ancylostoma duodenale TaxID=51022 RepID=A0A0C2G5X5_9BILA|nr:hypothetical protein ANCDUO_15535 [Ancylostoma duodenale]
MTICCEPSINGEEFKRFLSAADSTIKVQMREGQCVADTVVYKRNGKCTNLEKELIAKKQLGLPFTSVTKQSELVTLRMADRKVRVGGQIIYTPDKEDDLDDSDPDDDLNL